MAENDNVGNATIFEGKPAIYRALGLDEDGARGGQAGPKPEFSNLELDRLAARFDSWQNNLDIIAEGYAFDLGEVGPSIDDDEAAELFGDLDHDAYEDAVEFRETLAAIEEAQQACNEIGIDVSQESRGWVVRHGGRERGRGFGQKAGEYGFSPEHDRAAWLVYGRAGTPAYIATGRFAFKDIEDFEDEHWEYGQAAFGEDGVVELDTPNVQIFGEQLEGITDALELFSLIPDENKPRAEAIEYLRAREIEEDTLIAARSSRESLADLGFTEPAAAYKHEQIGSTVVLDRTIVSVGGDERQGFEWAMTKIPVPGVIGEGVWKPVVEEGWISPDELLGDEFLEWPAVHTDAYSVALWLAGNDSHLSPRLSSDALARRAIELAPHRILADDMRAGAATITRALGAAWMTDEQAQDVLEAFVHAQIATEATGIRHEAVRFAAGMGYDELMREAHSFDATWEGDPGLPFSWAAGDEPASIVLAPTSEESIFPRATVSPSIDANTHDLIGWVSSIETSEGDVADTRAHTNLAGAINRAAGGIEIACDADFSYSALHMAAYLSASKAIETAAGGKLGERSRGAILVSDEYSAAEVIGAAATCGSENASLAAAAYNLAAVANGNVDAARTSRYAGIAEKASMLLDAARRGADAAREARDAAVAAYVADPKDRIALETCEALDAAARFGGVEEFAGIVDEAQSARADLEEKQREQKEGHVVLAMMMAQREGFKPIDAPLEWPRSFIAYDDERHDYVFMSVTCSTGSEKEQNPREPIGQLVSMAQRWMDEHTDKFGIMDGMRVDYMTLTDPDSNQVKACIESNMERVRTVRPVHDARRILNELTKYMEGQLSGRGDGVCPMGSFDAARNRIEALADAVGGYDASCVKNDLAKACDKWKAAGLVCSGDEEGRDVSRVETR